MAQSLDGLKLRLDELLATSDILLNALEEKEHPDFVSAREELEQARYTVAQMFYEGGKPPSEVSAALDEFEQAVEAAEHQLKYRERQS